MGRGRERMSCVAALTVLVLSLAGSVRGEDAAIEELMSMSSSSRDRVVRLTDENYRSLAKGPKKYAIVVFFDAAMLKDNVQLNLPAFRKDFADVAKAYLDSDEAKAAGVPLFFADLEFKQSERAFKEENVNSLPHIKFFAPGSAEKMVTFDLNRYGKSFVGISNFLKDNGINTSGVRPPPPLSKTQMILLGILLVVLTPFVATYLLTRKTVLHEPRLWCLFGLCIYLFSVSGGMFNIIRNMPWYVPSREKPGEFVYFLKQQGSQFGVEGLIIGAFYTAVGLVLAFNLYILPQAKSVALKRGVGMLSIIGCAFAVRKVVELEVWKQGYWVHGFWPSSWRWKDYEL